VCLIAVAYRVHPDYPLVVAANRDEFYTRPTAPAAFWDDEPSILAGRDLECMGTWLGVTRGGRFAAVTNFRDPSDQRASAESRGTLVSRFLAGKGAAGEFMDEVEARADAYRGFNLIAYDSDGLYYYSNRGAEPISLAPGIYGLSNHLLDTPWPKVTRLRDRLSAALEPAPSVEPLLAMMADTTMAPDGELPHTGVGPERERMLSAARIVSASYGTRCSTVVMQSRQGAIRFAERTYGPEGAELDSATYEFQRAA
jgi:uncharacterized protein with NRDE domain